MKGQATMLNRDTLKQAQCNTPDLESFTDLQVENWHDLSD